MKLRNGNGWTFRTHVKGDDGRPVCGELRVDYRRFAPRESATCVRCHKGLRRRERVDPDLLYPDGNPKRKAAALRSWADPAYRERQRRARERFKPRKDV